MEVIFGEDALTVVDVVVVAVAVTVVVAVVGAASSRASRKREARRALRFGSGGGECCAGCSCFGAFVGEVVMEGDCEGEWESMVKRMGPASSRCRDIM